MFEDDEIRLKHILDAAREAVGLHRRSLPRRSGCRQETEFVFGSAT